MHCRPARSDKVFVVSLLDFLVCFTLSRECQAFQVQWWHWLTLVDLIKLEHNKELLNLLCQHCIRAICKKYLQRYLTESRQNQSRKRWEWIGMDALLQHVFGKSLLPFLLKSSLTIMLPCCSKMDRALEVSFMWRLLAVCVAAHAAELGGVWKRNKGCCLLYP